MEIIHSGLLITSAEHRCRIAEWVVGEPRNGGGVVLSRTTIVRITLVLTIVQASRVYPLE